MAVPLKMIYSMYDWDSGYKQRLLNHSFNFFIIRNIELPRETQSARINEDVRRKLVE